MAQARIAKRKKTKPAAKLVSVAKSEDAQRLEFASDGVSQISSLLGLGAKLPTMRWDASRSEHVAEIDPETRRDLLIQISQASAGVIVAIKTIALLITRQEKSQGDIARDEPADLGFTLHGLADLAEQLRSAHELLACAEPVGAPAAEPEVSHA